MTILSGLFEFLRWKEFSEKDLSAPTELLKGKLVNKIVTPLPYKVMIGTMIIGAIVAIAGIILKDLGIFFCGLLIFAISGLAAYSMRQLKTKRSFEDLKKDLKIDVGSLTKQQIEIKEKNKTLEASLKKTEALFQKYEKGLKEGNDEMDAFSKKITEPSNVVAATLTKLNAIEKIYPSLVESLTQYFSQAKKITSFSTETDQIFDRLLETIKIFDFTRSFLQRDISELRNHIESVQTLCTKLTPILTTITQMWEELKHSQTDAQWEHEQMKKQISQLTTLNEKLEIQIAEFQINQEGYNKYVTELRDLVAKDTQNIKSLSDEIRQKIAFERARK